MSHISRYNKNNKLIFCFVLFCFLQSKVNDCHTLVFQQIMSCHQNQVTAQRLSEEVNIFKLSCVNSILFRAQEMTQIMIMNKRFQLGPLETLWVNSVATDDMTLTATVVGQEGDCTTLVNVEMRGDRDVCFWAFEDLALVCEPRQSSSSSS